MYVPFHFFCVEASWVMSMGFASVGCSRLGSIWKASCDWLISVAELIFIAAALQSCP